MKEYKFEVHRVIKVHEWKDLVVTAEDYEDATSQLYEKVCEDEHFPLAIIREGTEPDESNEEASVEPCGCGQRLTGNKHGLWAECDPDLIEYELIE